ncbi:MAG: hypothetical protein BZY88_06445 [SAR202 cluster bacterium Io17-Chloro-G9]|nr:MAG: hypothetical protein BZY88_06445 [SAR202 cluster bacterium Io17-Chloro-G9]
MSEENKAIARRWNRIFEGQASEADAIIAPNIVYHDAPPGIPAGPEGVKAWAAMFEPLAGMRVEDEFYIAEGDIVIGRFVGKATHSNEFTGVPATGNQISVSGVNIFRISGGKIVEHWVNYDAMGLMQQIGAIPDSG